MNCNSLLTQYLATYYFHNSLVKDNFGICYKNWHVQMLSYRGIKWTYFTENSQAFWNSDYNSFEIWYSYHNANFRMSVRILFYLKFHKISWRSTIHLGSIHHSMQHFVSYCYIFQKPIAVSGNQNIWMGMWCLYTKHMGDWNNEIISESSNLSAW